VKKSEQASIHISVPEQRLHLKQGTETVRSYPVSTSKFGIGSEEGSMKTPIGRFRVAEKIGAGMPSDTVFKSRLPVTLSAEDAAREDLVMSRILWLDGVENHNSNTRDRFIYIHGTNHEDEIGAPASHGCIRMKNTDLIELFELVPEGADVVVEA
jgi:L,D-transpeptidase YbiS